MTKENLGNVYKIGDKIYDQAVYDKYLNNMRSERRALALGESIEFKGFPDYYSGITTRAFFTKQTLEELQSRVVEPVKRFANQYSIAIYPMDLWTPHVTLADLRYQPKTAMTKDEVLQRLTADKRVENANNTLAGKEMTFDVLFGGSAIVLAATKLPPEILEVREQMSRLAQEYRMGEKDMKNIVHITVARIAHNPRDSIQPANSNLFGRELMRLHYAILANAIHASIEGAELMSNQQFEAEHEYKLMRYLQE